MSPNRLICDDNPALQISANIYYSSASQHEHKNEKTTGQRKFSAVNKIMNKTSHIVSSRVGTPPFLRDPPPPLISPLFLTAIQIGACKL